MTVAEMVAIAMAPAKAVALGSLDMTAAFRSGATLTVLFDAGYNAAMQAQFMTQVLLSEAQIVRLTPAAEAEAGSLYALELMLLNGFSMLP